MQLLSSFRTVASLVYFAALIWPQGARADAFIAVCERTPAVATAIVSHVNELQGTQKTCQQVTADDLATIPRVSVEYMDISQFKAGDFSGLTTLEILNIRSNPYTTLPEGLFDGLTNLKTLVIIGTSLRYLPDDFLAATPNLENIHCFRNNFRTISESVLQRFSALAHVQVIDVDDELFAPEKDRLRSIFANRPEVRLFFR